MNINERMIWTLVAALLFLGGGMVIATTITLNPVTAAKLTLGAFGVWSAFWIARGVGR